MQCKYVITREGYPILFPFAMNHSDFRNIDNLLSAGFVDITDEEVSIWGKSESTGLKPLEDDKTIIEKYLRV
jgi:hypothetical protein